MNSVTSFQDILKPRRKEFSNLAWVSRKLDTLVAYKQIKRPKPETHKLEVLTSQRITELLQKLSKDTGKPVQELEVLVKSILDEIGFNKQIKVIRWLGLVLTKINQKIYTGIYVNEDSIHRLKSVMGKCPIIFAPSHRSYADFILMSYICFNYDIEIPAIAAGMDFHGMWVMGSILRDTGAFFMRRSYNDDKLYWETFKQYVHQIVTRGDLPVEFFIEGTRSRSCKSLIPKFGLLSMLMKPLFTGEVPDILIVPINISYERVLEEKLFAFELLGIPKPKESTSGFLKSLSIIKENYGSIYVDFTTPISAKEYFREKLNRLGHSVGPLHHQQLDTEDKFLINDVGYEILRVQRQHAVLLPFNLAAVFLASNNDLTISSLESSVDWLRKIVQELGARVADTPLIDIFKVHNKLIQIVDGNVELIRNEVNLDNVDNGKLKAHRLSNQTMTEIIPHIMLQIYVNPILYYFADCCLVIIEILTFGQDIKIGKDDLFDSYKLLRAIFSSEFTFYNKEDEMAFKETLQKLQRLGLIKIINNEFIVLISCEKLEKLFINLLNPFIVSYFYLCQILQTMSVMFLIEHKAVLTETQKMLEVSFLSSQNVHPYSLNLDTLSNGLLSLTNLGALMKTVEQNKLKYKVNMEKLCTISTKLSAIIAKCYKGLVFQPAQISIHLQAKL